MVYNERNGNEIITMGNQKLASVIKEIGEIGGFHWEYTTPLQMSCGIGHFNFKTLSLSFSVFRINCTWGFSIQYFCHEIDCMNTLIKLGTKQGRIGT